MGVIGDGTFVKNLWILSPWNEWIPVPFGAGQDDVLRSVNIWDGKKWWVPTWGWAELRRLGKHRGDLLPSLEVRATGPAMAGDFVEGVSVFEDSRDYPFGRPFNPFFANWVRLFHARPRPNPEWRILHIGPPYPAFIPNRIVNWQTTVPDRTYFRGAMTTYRWVADNTDMAHAVPSRGYQNLYPPDFIWHGQGGYLGDGAVEQQYAEHVYATWSDRTSNSASYTGQYSHGLRMAMIDFQAIRQRLIDYYREQGPDFIGQYDPIELMDIRRVYVKGSVGMTVSAHSDHPFDASILEHTGFTMYAQSGAIATATTQEVQTFYGYGAERFETCTARRPATFSPGGSIVYQENSVNLSQGIDNETSISFFGDGSANSYVKYSSSRYNNPRRNFHFVVENPGHDNLTLSALVTSPPLAPPPTSAPTTQPGGTETYIVTEAVADFEFRVEEITIHWAYPGVDTPPELHRWDGWG